MSIQWSDELSVGVPEVDVQHQELIARVAKLFDAMRLGDRSEGARLLEYLGTYVVEHFAAEERLMAAVAYPGLAEHQAEHAALTETYRRLRERYREHGPTAHLTLELNQTLTPWLKDHILGSDKQMGRFMRTSAPAAHAGAAQERTASAHPRVRTDLPPRRAGPA